MTVAPATSTVHKALSAHAAIGLLAGALLYIVCLSGTVLVLYQEWQRAEQPAAPEMTGIAPQAVQRAVESVLASEVDETRTTHLYVHLPTPDLPRTTITTDHQAVHVAADGSLAVPEENGWSEFLYALHYTLNLPSLVGITLVGALGVMLLALAISGVVAHPRIFRDAFRLRARHGGGVGLADWHNRLSVWTLPFSVAIALTGAVIGLASIAAYGLATGAYAGDVEAVYAPLFGDEPEPDRAPARVPDVAAALHEMDTRFPDIALTYTIVHDPGTAGQHVQMVGTHPRRLIFGEYYGFDAAGNFTGSAGLADGELGQQAAASTYNLHFGNYGGLPVKLIYILLGAAVTAICATGTYIWLGKRRRRGLDEPGLRAAWTGVICAAPAALVVTFLARFVIGNDTPFAAIFWIITCGSPVALVLARRKHGPAIMRSPTLDRRDRPLTGSVAPGTPER